MQVNHYLTQDGHDIFHEWIARLRDTKGLTAIVRRIDRIARQGYLGDHKYCRDGVWELRIDSGPGIVCTTAKTMVKWCCFSVVVTKKRSVKT